MSYLGYLPNTVTIIRKKLLPKIIIYNPKTPTKTLTYINKTALVKFLLKQIFYL